MTKLCEFENCRNIANYAFYYMKPQKCKEHKEEGMKVKTQICICGKYKPSFGLEIDQKKTSCSECKTDDMINLGCYRCKCKKSSCPVFGLITDKIAKYCSECKTEEMINIKSKKCPCGIRPNFGLITDNNPTCCAKCKTDDMIDLINKKCKCGTQPTFGLPNEITPSCCSKCKTDNMIDLKNKKCPCGTQPTFGLPNDITPSCCKKCKTNEMINIVTKKCVCGKARPSFGLLNDKKVVCCAKCKTDNMIDLINKHKLCPCGINPVFGLSTDERATCCSKCKTEDMVDLVTKKCLCGIKACFGLPNNLPTCCSKCKTIDMIDLVTKKCKANEQNIICTKKANKKYKGYCTNCYANLFPNDPLTFQIRCKTKEIAVRDFINSVFEGFQHDQPLWTGNCDCTHRRRIDHRKLIGNTLLSIETDENQHKYYDKKKELIRYDDVMMIHGGKFIFIRFNPDKYKEKGVSKNPTIASRLRTLEEEINKQIKRIENEENAELLEIIPMYYDTN